MLDQAGLQVRGLAKSYGGLQAVHGLDFSVQAGECVALIGPNGAGKSTTFACIAGQQQPSAGQLLWQGRLLNGLAPSQRLALGLARTFQVAQTFEALTVLQNVQLVLPGVSRLLPWKRLDHAQPQPALALLACVGLQEQAHSVAAALPYGAKKRLELAMALAGIQGQSDGPGLLLLDEPAAGLAPTERRSLMQLVRGLTRRPHNGTGLAVLYTEHNMDAVFGFADRVLVLLQGRLAAAGTPQEVAVNPLVRSQYLGQGVGHWEQDAHA